MPSREQKPSPAPSPHANLFLESFQQTRELYQPEKVQHEKFGLGFRFRFGETSFTVYKPADSSPRVDLQAPNQSIRVVGVTALHAVAEEQGEPAGILITSPTLNIYLKTNGSFTTTYAVLGSQDDHAFQIPAVPPTIEGGQQPVAANKLGQEAPERTESGSLQKEKQRVKASGFFGKVLDGFPRETEGDEKRRIYKLLIGNKAAEQPEDGKEKIDWITVTAHTPHVVKYLDEHVADFKKRETRLHVEGYYQEFETTLRRTGKVKKTQELYALSIQVQGED